MMRQAGCSSPLAEGHHGPPRRGDVDVRLEARQADLHQRAHQVAHGHALQDAHDTDDGEVVLHDVYAALRVPDGTRLIDWRARPARGMDTCLREHADDKQLERALQRLPDGGPALGSRLRGACVRACVTGRRASALAGRTVSAASSFLKASTMDTPTMKSNHGITKSAR
jgi:hypothetical protein